MMTKPASPRNAQYQLDRRPSVAAQATSDQVARKKSTVKAKTGTQPKANRSGRSSHNMTLLNTALVAGSVLATLVGTNLLARDDANAAMADAVESEVAAIDTTANPALILAPIPTLYAAPPVDPAAIV